MRTVSLLFIAGLVMRPSARACDCAMELPGSFCATMDTAWYTPPDAVVLGVKLDEVEYGMRVKVLQVFQGNVAVDDTLMVWGEKMARVAGGT